MHIGQREARIRAEAEGERRREAPPLVLGDIAPGDLAVVPEHVQPDRRTRNAEPGERLVQVDRAALQIVGPEAERSRGERVEPRGLRSEEHTSELQSLMRISYAVFCLKKKKT